MSTNTTTITPPSIKKQGFLDGFKWVTFSLILAKQNLLHILILSILSIALLGVCFYTPVFNLVIATWLGTTYLLWGYFVNDIRSGVSPSIKISFVRIRQIFWPLINLGVLYLIGLGVASLLALGGFFAFSGEPQTIPLGGASYVNSGDNLVGAGVFLIVFFILWCALTSFFIFAPALIAFQEMSVLKAMRHSAAGVLKNINPLIAFGIVSFVMFIFSTVSYGVFLIVALPTYFIGLHFGYTQIWQSDTTHNTSDEISNQDTK